MKVTLRGFPWQSVDRHWATDLDKTTGTKWGWNPLEVKGMGRYGGGWAIKVGITASSDFKDVCIDTGIGQIRIVRK